MTAGTIVLYVLLGTLIGAALCMIPSLHIYNVTGIALLIWFQVRALIPYDAIAPFFMSMMVAYTFLSTIPMTFFAAADESAGATILPSLDMLLVGKGRDASILTGLGSLFGAGILLVFTPFFYYIWTYVSAVCRPHMHWILGLIMVFYVISEWPKGCGRGATPWVKLQDGWRNIWAGLGTFALSAFVGIVITTKPLSPPDLAFQNIMPVFLGFFAFPSVLQYMLSEVEIPRQYRSKHLNAGWSDFAVASVPGIMAGLMASYIPAVTIGIAAIFSSHFTNHRALLATSFEKSKEPGTVIYLHTPENYYQQERVFVIAGGIMKMLYYVGAFLLIFVLTDITPHGMGRGGLNVLLRPIFTAEKGDYFVMISTVVFSSALSMLLLLLLTDLTIAVLPRLNVRAIYIASTILLVGILYFMGGGVSALGVAAVTTCIGSIPVFYGCRRSHCMAVLLVPIALNMAGYGDDIARLMGLA